MKRMARVEILSLSNDKVFLNISKMQWMDGWMDMDMDRWIWMDRSIDDVHSWEMVVMRK